MILISNEMDRVIEKNPEMIQKLPCSSKASDRLRNFDHRLRKEKARIKNKNNKHKNLTAYYYSVMKVSFKDQNYRDLCLLLMKK